MWSHIVIFLGSAAVFWIPAILVNVLGEGEISDIASLLFLTIGISTVSLFAIPRLLQFYSTISTLRAALTSVLGIWITGPVWMLVLTSLSGREPANPGVAWVGLIPLILLFPFITISFSAHTGTMYALLITTAGLIIFGMRQFTGLWPKKVNICSSGGKGVLAQERREGL